MESKHITTTAYRITGDNYIGNEASNKGHIQFKTFNPELNQENSFTFTEASDEEIQKAVLLASEAFEVYKSISGERKSAFLNAIADAIENIGDLLIETYCSETGLPEGRAIGERGRTIFQLRTFANLVKNGNWVEATIDTADPDRKPVPKPDLRKMNIPIGPVVVFGASNFPLAYSTAGGDTAAALAAGCPVIVKSHPMHAGTGELVASAILKAAAQTNMPNGVFSNLHSSGIEVGEKLVKHPKIKAVGFTGSIKGGRALLDLASQRKEPIPVFAEMGSINPVILLPKALEKRGSEIAKTYANSITVGTGQFCTNPGLLIGLESVHFKNFIQHLGKEMLAISPTCMLHPNIQNAFQNNRQKASEQPNVETIANYNTTNKPNYAAQMLTSVSAQDFLENPKLHEEVFGPFSIAVTCKDKEEMQRVITQLEGQLTGTIMGEILEVEGYQNIVDALSSKVGRIIFNGVPTGVEVCNAMVHGGPYPASTDSRFSAVGASSIKRWVRPFSFQNWPNEFLPKELKNENPLGISRVINNESTTKPI